MPVIKKFKVLRINVGTVAARRGKPAAGGRSLFLIEMAPAYTADNRKAVACHVRQNGGEERPLQISRMEWSARREEARAEIGKGSGAVKARLPPLLGQGRASVGALFQGS